MVMRPMRPPKMQTHAIHMYDLFDIRQSSKTKERKKTAGLSTSDTIPSRARFHKQHLLREVCCRIFGLYVIEEAIHNV